MSLNRFISYVSIKKNLEQTKLTSIYPAQLTLTAVQIYLLLMYLPHSFKFNSAKSNLTPSVISRRCVLLTLACFFYPCVFRTFAFAFIFTKHIINSSQILSTKGYYIHTHKEKYHIRIALRYYYVTILNFCASLSFHLYFLHIERQNINIMCE